VTESDDDRPFIVLTETKLSLYTECKVPWGHGTLVRIKRRGFSGTKGFVFPLIKLVCSSFMMSSVPHEIAAHEGAVPVPFRHRW
jgi:hypothetical protein